MLITKIGEFGLIERIRKIFKTDSSVIKGIGDDCAVLRFDKDKYLLSTCDMLVEGTDFTVKHKPYFVGRKALAVSISDIAACGGLPRYALISIGIPNKLSVKYIDNVYKGINDLAKAYRINVVGGDVSQMGRLVIDVQLLGIVEKRCLVLRDGARKGDVIFVSGRLGGSIYGGHLSFNPRLEEARFLVQNFSVNSMIDISDGLAQDLSHILKQSKVGALIYEDRIPLGKEARGVKDALYMGEDFELLFTLSKTEARRVFAKRPVDFKPIGEIVDKKYGLRLVDKNCREKKIKYSGFQHF